MGHWPAIGRQYATKLHTAGIGTAAGLAGCSEAFARKHLGGVVGARLVRELQGQPCQGLAPSEDGHLARRSLCCSRTFGRPLTDFPDVTGAVSAFASRAAEKLRRQGDAAHLLTVFLSKSRFGKGTVQLASLVLPPGQTRTPWAGQTRWRTPQYTTRLEDLLLVG